MSRIDLRPFCARRERHARWMRWPFRYRDIGGKVRIGATNGHIFASVPDDGRRLKNEAPPSLEERLGKMFKQCKVEPGTPLALAGMEVPEQNVCGYCKGRDRCKHFPADSCGRCSFGYEFAGFDVGESAFAPRYLKLIQAMPDSTLLVRRHPEVSMFEFTGGYGFVMPVHK